MRLTALAVGLLFSLAACSTAEGGVPVTAAPGSIPLATGVSDLSSGMRTSTPETSTAVPLLPFGTSIQPGDIPHTYAAESSEPMPSLVDEGRVARPETEPVGLPERVPEPTTTPPITGETPSELLARIIADAANRAGVSDSEVTVVRDEFAIWNDGSLNCPRPGEFYTQALVDGYWVVIQTADLEYDYRATATGYFKLCTSGIAGKPVG